MFPLPSLKESDTFYRCNFACSCATRTLNHSPRASCPHLLMPRNVSSPTASTGAICHISSLPFHREQKTVPLPQRKGEAVDEQKSRMAKSILGGRTTNSPGICLFSPAKKLGELPCLGGSTPASCSTLARTPCGCKSRQVPPGQVSKVLVAQHQVPASIPRGCSRSHYMCVI